MKMDQGPLGVDEGWLRRRQQSFPYQTSPGTGRLDLGLRWECTPVRLTNYLINLNLTFRRTFKTAVSNSSIQLLLQQEIFEAGAMDACVSSFLE